MSDIVERLQAKWKAAPMLGGGSLNGPCYIRDDGMCLRNPDGPEAAETILALRKEVERLRGALGPFAQAAEDIDESTQGVRDMWEHPASMNITAGDFRRARAALATEAE